MPAHSNDNVSRKHKQQHPTNPASKSFGIFRKCVSMPKLN